MSNIRPSQIKVAATYMRGGTSKGVFFNLSDLPEEAQKPGKARDALLLRVIGSPDPYAKQIDGMGGATSSTSKTVIVSPSSQPEHDVITYLGKFPLISLLLIGAEIVETIGGGWPVCDSCRANPCRAYT